VNSQFYKTEKSTFTPKVLLDSHQAGKACQSQKL